MVESVTCSMNQGREAVSFGFLSDLVDRNLLSFYSSLIAVSCHCNLSATGIDDIEMG